MAAKCALVVDDSKSARAFLSRILEKHGLDVDGVESAEDAIEYLTRHRPDVIFMDHLMPGMDGFQAVQAIKNNPRTATIPILMYTSQEGELYLGQARALGAMGVLPKQIRPADVTQVLAQLHLFERRETPAPKPAEPGPNDPTLVAPALSGVTTLTTPVLPPELQPPAPTAPAEAATAGQTGRYTFGSPVDQLLRDQIAEVRRTLVARLDELQDGLPSQLQAAVRATTPPPAPVPPPLPAPDRRGWLAAAGLGALALLFAVLWSRELGQRDAVERSLAALVEREQTVAAQSSTEVAPPAEAPVSTTVRPAAAERPRLPGPPLSFTVPYGETPLAADRVGAIRGALEELRRAGFRGDVDIQTFTGRFCLVGNAGDGYALPPDDMVQTQVRPRRQPEPGRRRQPRIAGLRQHAGRAAQGGRPGADDPRHRRARPAAATLPRSIVDADRGRMECQRLGQQPRRAALARTLLKEFLPRGLLRNAHVQSVFPSLALHRRRVLRRAAPLLAASREHVVDCGEGTRLQAFESTPAAPPVATVLLLHGWEGSATAGYLLSLGQQLFALGHRVLRLNLRDHGDTHALNRELFHSCRLPEVTGAVQALARRFDDAPFFGVGFSLGGNFLLRVAAEAGSATAGLRRVIAISPVLDPARTLHALERGVALYRRYFVWKWSRSLRRKQALWGDEHDFSDVIAHADLRRMTAALVRDHTTYAGHRCVPRGLRHHRWAAGQPGSARGAADRGGRPDHSGRRSRSSRAGPAAARRADPLRRPHRLPAQLERRNRGRTISSAASWPQRSRGASRAVPRRSRSARRWSRSSRRRSARLARSRALAR